MLFSFANQKCFENETVNNAEELMNHKLHSLGTDLSLFLPGDVFAQIPRS